MLKKLLLVTLAMLLAVSSAACSGGGAAEAAPPAEGNAAEPVAGETAAPGELPPQTSPIKYFCRTNGGRETMPDNPKLLAYIEERTGIQLEVTAIANESVKEKIDLMIAASEEIDAINLVGYEDTYMGLLDKGAIVPINELLDLYGPNVKTVMADGLPTATDKDGNIWGLPRAEKFPMGYVPSIRGDWLEALGMEMPTTMPELDAYLAAVKEQDLNGNGDPGDEIPLLPNGLTYAISNFFPYYLPVKDGNMTSSGFSTKSARYMAEDGTIRSIVSHPDMINIITKFNEWYTKGYMPMDIHLLKTAQFGDIRKAGTFGMQAGWYLDGSGDLVDWSAANPDSPRAWTDPIPPLTDAPSGRSLWPSNPKNAPQIMFFKTGKNHAYLMKYFDWICSDPQNNLTVNFGIEGEHWNWTEDGSVEVSTYGQENYNEFYSLANLYWPSIMPKLVTSPENPKQFETYRLMDTIRAWDKSNSPFDAHVPYNYEGTEAEFLTADGTTLMEEAITKMVIGEMPLTEWESTLATYNAIEGDIYSQVWTDQYYEFIGEPRP